MVDGRPCCDDTGFRVWCGPSRPGEWPHDPRMDRQRVQCARRGILAALIEAPSRHLRQMKPDTETYYALIPGPAEASLSRFNRWISSLSWSLRMGHLEAEFLAALKMKPTRTQSGVAPITVLTKPYPCLGGAFSVPMMSGCPRVTSPRSPGRYKRPIIASTRMHKRGTEFCLSTEWAIRWKIGLSFLGARGPLTRVRTRCCHPML